MNKENDSVLECSNQVSHLPPTHRDRHTGMLKQDKQYALPADYQHTYMPKTLAQNVSPLKDDHFIVPSKLIHRDRRTGKLK